MIYYDNEFITVTWDAEIQSVIGIWKKFAPSQVYREAMDKMVDLAEQKRAKGLLGDTRNFKAVATNDQQWTIEEWTPRMLQAGVIRSAAVVPASTLGQISITNMTGRADVPRDSATQYFSDLMEARQWMKAELAKF
jgi:hypothetical protein